MQESCKNCRFFKGATEWGVSVKLPDRSLVADWHSADLDNGDQNDSDTAAAYEDFKCTLFFRNTFEDVMDGCGVFDHLPDNEKPIGLRVSQANGLCRRHPPTSHKLVSINQWSQTGIASSIFPIVTGDDWCGEYQPVKS